jgi:hypothetical protein
LEEVYSGNLNKRPHQRSPKSWTVGNSFQDISTDQIRGHHQGASKCHGMAWLKCSSAIYEHHQATALCPGVMTTMHMLAGLFYYFVTAEGVHKGGNRL